MRGITFSSLLYYFSSSSDTQWPIDSPSFTMRQYLNPFMSYSCMQACMCACVCSFTQQGSTYHVRQVPNHSRPPRCWRWRGRCHGGLQSGCRWAQGRCTTHSGAPSGCRTPCRRWRTQRGPTKGRPTTYCPWRSPLLADMELGGGNIYLIEGGKGKHSWFVSWWLHVMVLFWMDVTHAHIELLFNCIISDWEISYS